MKNLAFIFALFPFFLSSCMCDECIGNFNELTFKTNLDTVSGFHPVRDFDSVYIVRFEKATGFLTPLDTSSIKAHAIYSSGMVMFSLGTRERATFANFNYSIYSLHPAFQVNISNIKVGYHNATARCDCNRYELNEYTVNDTFVYPHSGYYFISK